MLQRKSAFGLFWGCPNSTVNKNHGTVSISQSQEQYNNWKRQWLGFTVIDGDLVDEMREF